MRKEKHAIDFLNGILDFLSTSRRVATTEFIQKIAKDNDIHTIVTKNEYKKDYGDCSIHYKELSGVRNSKPVLFDSYIILKIIRTSLDHVNKLNKYILKQKLQIQDLNKRIAHLEELLQSIKKQVK